MSKVLLITNIPAPYRVDLFYYMQTHQQTHEFFVIYTNRNEDNRQWVIDERKLLQSTILESKIIKHKGEGDVHYLHIPQHLTREITRINPDVVIAWEYNPSALKALLWCKRHGRKFIHLTDGTLRSERNIGRVQKLMRHIIIHHADACIASSTKAKEKLLHWGVPERKIFISLLTVDISRFRYAEKRENQHTLLFVGRIIPLKGLDLLLRALPKVHQPFELLIVGDGEVEEKTKLMAMAEETHVAQHIRWLGFQSGEPLADAYRRASVFVLPTREDCFGLVLLEALCSGTPIVASKYADGAYDTVHPGENGLIVDPEDADALAEAIDSILGSEEIQRRYSQNCRQYIPQFEFEAVMQGYLQAIASVTSGNK